MPIHDAHVCVCLVAQSCPTLCDPKDCYPPGSSVHGISKGKIIQWVAISSSRGSFQPSHQTLISCLADRFFTTESSGIFVKMDYCVVIIIVVFIFIIQKAYMSSEVLIEANMENNLLTAIMNKLFSINKT